MIDTMFVYGTFFGIACVGVAIGLSRLFVFINSKRIKKASASSKE